VKPPYRGFCFGGPNHDQWTEGHVPMFATHDLRFPIRPYSGPLTEEILTVENVIYKWSRSLGKWCVVEM
jgi:hypothetical protein